MEVSNEKLDGAQESSRVGMDMTARINVVPGYRSDRTLGELDAKNNIDRYLKEQWIEFQVQKERGKLCDLTLELCDGHLQVHSALLSLASPFISQLLSAMCQCNEEPKNRNLLLPDISCTEMNSVLSLLYSGRCNVVDVSLNRLKFVLNILGMNKVLNSLSLQICTSPNVYVSNNNGNINSNQILETSSNKVTEKNSKKTHKSEKILVSHSSEPGACTPNLTSPPGLTENSQLHSKSTLQPLVPGPVSTPPPTPALSESNPKISTPCEDIPNIPDGHESTPNMSTLHRPKARKLNTMFSSSPDPFPCPHLESTPHVKEGDMNSNFVTEPKGSKSTDICDRTSPSSTVGSEDNKTLTRGIFKIKNPNSVTQTACDEEFQRPLSVVPRTPELLPRPRSAFVPVSQNNKVLTPGIPAIKKPLHEILLREEFPRSTSVVPQEFAQFPPRPNSAFMPNNQFHTSPGYYGYPGYNLSSVFSGFHPGYQFNPYHSYQPYPGFHMPGMFPTPMPKHNISQVEEGLRSSSTFTPQVFRGSTSVPPYLGEEYHQDRWRDRGESSIELEGQDEIIEPGTEAENMIHETGSGVNEPGIRNKVPRTRSKSHIELGSGLIEEKNDYKVHKKYGRIITRGFVCIFCGSGSESKYQLKLHYFYKHFYRQISDMFPKSTRHCAPCNQSFQSNTVFLKHYGMKHNAVEIMLEEFSQGNQSEKRDQQNLDKPGRANLGQGGSGDQMRTDKDGLMDHIIAEDQDQMRSEDQDQMRAEDQDPGGPMNHWRSEDQNQCRAENQDQVSSEDQRRDEQYRLSENKALGNFSPGKFEKTESELEVWSSESADAEQDMNCSQSSTEETKDESIGLKKLIYCCMMDFALPMFLHHCVRHHFRRKIQADLAQSFLDTKGRCTDCERMCSDIWEYSDHLGVDHFKVVPYLAQEYRYRKQYEIVESILPTVSEQESPRLKKLNLKRGKESETRKLKCPLCTKEYGTKPLIYRHLVDSHFYTQLKKILEKNYLEKNFCDCKVTFPTLRVFIRHFGISHGYVNQLCSPQVLRNLRKGIKAPVQEKWTLLKDFGSNPSSRESLSRKSRVRFPTATATSSSPSLVCIPTASSTPVRSGYEQSSTPKLSPPIQPAGSSSSTGRETIRSLTQTKRSFGRGNEQTRATIYYCQICNISKAGFKTFLSHLSNSHYRRELRREFKIPGVNPPVIFNCPTCSVSLKSTNYYSHIGSKHQEVLKYATWFNKKPIQESDDRGEVDDKNEQEVEEVEEAEDDVNQLIDSFETETGGMMSTESAGSMVINFL